MRNRLVRSTVASQRGHFIILGAKKCATTSLFHWLGEHPDVHLSRGKEPGFFSDDEQWQRGVGWYDSLFAGAEEHQITGEAGNYANAHAASVAITRTQAVVPDVRLIYIVREPLRRLRSEYRHEIQRGREHRPLATALTDPGTRYVANSCYHRLIAPWLDAFGEQVLIVRFEDLVGPREHAWRQVLAHLGLEPVPRPETVHNRTRDRPRFTALFRWLWEHGLDRPLSRLPRPVRRLGRRLLLRDDAEYRRLLEESRTAPIPPAVRRRIQQDVSRLEQRLGRGRLWP